MTVVDCIRERASEAPDQPALISDDGSGTSRTLSYRELVERFEDHLSFRPCRIDKFVSLFDKLEHRCKRL